MEEKQNNLNTFRVLYLIRGILIFFFSLFFVIYAVAGNFIFSDIVNKTPQVEDELPFNPGIIFMIVGIIGAIISFIFGVMNILAAKFIADRKNYMFIFIVGCLNCATGMLGILLGIFTIIEFSKAEVKALFGRGEENKEGKKVNY